MGSRRVHEVKRNLGKAIEILLMGLCREEDIVLSVATLVGEGGAGSVLEIENTAE